MSNLRTAANLIAIEWDHDEIRIASARRVEAGYVARHAFSIELPSSGNGDQQNSSKENATAIGTVIAKALSERRISRGDVIVVMGRSQVELQQMSFPPIPADELPGMVRMQAAQHFESPDEQELCIDYVPLGPSNGHGTTVLAAAICPQRLADVELVCKEAGLSLKQIALRPCLTSVLSSSENSSSLQLLAQDLGDEVDMAVVNDGQLAFMRTARLPNSNGHNRNELLAHELRRTLFSVKNEADGSTVDQVVVFGAPSSNGSTENELSRRLNCEVELNDPFSTWTHEVDSVPPHPERFTPLLAVLSQSDSANQINFLSPRKPTPPVDHRRRFAIAGAVAAIVALLVAGYIYSRFTQLDRTIAQKKALLIEAKKTTEQAAELLQNSEIVENWVSRDPVWLDELYRVADRFPENARAKLSRMEIRSEDSGSLMILQAFVDDSKTISEIEEQLRDDHRQVFGDGGRQSTNDSKYPWRFTARMKVELPDSDAAKQLGNDTNKRHPRRGDSGENNKNGGTKSTVPTSKKAIAGEQDSQVASVGAKTEQQPASPNAGPPRDKNMATNETPQPAEQPAGTEQSKPEIVNDKSAVNQ